MSSLARAATGATRAHRDHGYGYEDEKLVIAEGGWAMMPPFGFQMRFHIALETATLDFDLPARPEATPLDGQRREDRADLRAGRRLLAADRPFRPAGPRRTDALQ